MLCHASFDLHSEVRPLETAFFFGSRTVGEQLLVSYFLCCHWVHQVEYILQLYLYLSYIHGSAFGHRGTYISIVLLLFDKWLVNARATLYTLVKRTSSSSHLSIDIGYRANHSNSKVSKGYFFMMKLLKELLLRQTEMLHQWFALKMQHFENITVV